MNLDFTQVKIDKLITHHVGNKLRDERFILSQEETTISNETSNFLLKYFLLSIRTNEFFQFSHPIKLELNNMFAVIDNLFSAKDTFLSSSQNIAKLLYEKSMHPKIKEGELNVVFFSNIYMEDEVVDAVGVFKSETNVPFLKMKNKKSNFNIQHEYGFDIKGMDKGCIIFNSNKNNGYKLLIAGNAERIDSQYWKDDFLEVKPISDEYQYTNSFLGIAKNYVTSQLEDNLGLNKADKIDLLNRSVDYFKTHDSFNKEEFENEVFQNSEIINSFQRFDNSYREINEIQMTDNFNISPQAVKKQIRAFKSVLKLDKNFDIYIHGNRELIEQGVEKDGRKYYKIYFDKEL